MSSAALIALDWGTTRARAFRIDATGRVLDTRSGDLGVQRLSGATFPQALAQLTGDWSDERAPRLACGMIGSRQGWREAAYVACPAGIDALAGALLEVDAGAGFRIVPGVSVVDGDGVPDVMRGEETQIFGLDAADGVAVLPGTHSKWVLVEGGRITRFATFMTGEAFAAMSGHTILGRLMTGTDHDEDGFARGVAHGGRDAAGRGGLLHRLFGARTLGLFDRVPGHALHSYLSGLLIGAEIAEARAWLGRPPAEVAVIGAPALARSYAAALGAGGIRARIAPADAAARGAYAIARRAGLVA